MSTEALLESLQEKMRTELVGNCIPYWTTRAFDSSKNQFFARIDGNNQIDLSADHVCILHSRILWFFSSAFRVTQDSNLRYFSEAAYSFFSTSLWDGKHGGVFWSVDPDGKPTNSRKHTYGQAFAIFALSEYARAFNSADALKKAKELFFKLEKYAWHGGSVSYYECFDRFWNPLDDVRLGDSDLNASRSFNTHLHLLEAFTTLYKVWPDDLVKRRLQDLIDLHLEKIWNPEINHFLAFFDSNWSPISPMYSYGHDIEASWLLTDAAHAIQDEKRGRKTSELAQIIAKVTISEGLDSQNGGIFNSGNLGQVSDTDKHWWAQAEAIVGLCSVFQENNDESLLEISTKIWNFIDTTVIDHQFGEWFWRVNQRGIPYTEEDKVGPWKCPYHTGRACLEIMERFPQVVLVTK